jgi:hypothetical protein
VTDGILQSTLRDWRSCFTKRPVLVGMLALGVLLGRLTLCALSHWHRCVLSIG